MRTPILLAIPLSLATLFACHSNTRSSSPLWVFSYSSDPTSKWDSILSRASFIDLHTDHTYTQDFGHFDYGEWSLKRNELYLTNQKHKTYIFRVISMGPNLLSLYLGTDKIAFFQRMPSPSSRASKDPFSLDNNRWRFPPAHKENIDEIRQRLLNHYQFWEAYFKWGSDNDVNAIDVADIPTPMKIYGNGFGLKKYDSLSTRWKACFFDEEDCHNADTLIKGIFRRNKFKWPDTEDQGRLFVSGVQQVENFLR
jgi:hypothetical protein